MAKEKKNRLRFIIEDDLCLLTEVLVENPFETPSRWENIKDTVVKSTKKVFSTRTIKEHVDYLVKVFSQDDWKNRKKSGTEEQRTERESLLQDIKDLARDFRKNSTENSTDNDCMLKNDKQKAVQFRNESASAFSSSLDTDTSNHCDYEGPSRKRVRSNTKNAGLDYLREKNSIERELKKREMDLEERRIAIRERELALEEAEFELKRTERLKRLAMESLDRDGQCELIRQQQQLMSRLLDKK